MAPTLPAVSVDDGVLISTPSGSMSTRAMQFTVSLSRPLERGESASVWFATADGTARGAGDDRDYLDVRTSLWFDHTSGPTRTVRVPVVKETYAPGSHFFATLDRVEGAAPADLDAIGVLASGDDPVLVSVGDGRQRTTHFGQSGVPSALRGK